MKRVALVVAVSAVIVVSPILGVSQPAEPRKVIELSASNFFPATSLHSILPKQWLKQIEQRCKGRVKITYYPGGSLTPAQRTYGGVVGGITDIGMSVFAYTAGRFPVFGLVNYPHGYADGWVATKVTNDFYNKFKPAEVNDTHVLYLHASSPQALFTTKKPVRKLEDLKGLVIRSTGTAAVLMEALGAKGYGASMGETYELLSKNVVDGSFAGVGVLKDWKQAEVVKYVTFTYAVGSTSVFFVVMNKGKWNSLPEDIKNIFTEVSVEMGEKHAMVWDYQDFFALEYFLSFPGREVIKLPPEEMARWTAVAKPVIDKQITELNTKGFAGDEYERYLVERVKYWSNRAQKIEKSVAWVKSELEPLLTSK